MYSITSKFFTKEFDIELSFKDFKECLRWTNENKRIFGDKHYNHKFIHKLGNEFMDAVIIEFYGFKMYAA